MSWPQNQSLRAKGYQMRNQSTEKLGKQLTAFYREENLSPDEFINSAVQLLSAFDITYLGPCNNDRYACFHLVHNNTVHQAYYWESRDEWFVKAS